jgi:hypothetical protein
MTIFAYAGCGWASHCLDQLSLSISTILRTKSMSCGLISLLSVSCRRRVCGCVREAQPCVCVVAVCSQMQVQQQHLQPPYTQSIVPVVASWQSLPALDTLQHHSPLLSNELVSVNQQSKHALCSGDLAIL